MYALVSNSVLQMIYVFIPQCNSLKAKKKNPEHSLAGYTKFPRFLCLKVFCHAIGGGVWPNKS